LQPWSTRQTLTTELMRLRTPKIPVFVSATSELSEVASALKAELPPEVYRVFWYQDAAAGSDSPYERCLQEIHQSDVFICLVGSQYGSTIDRDDPRSQSATQWEYCQAMRRPTGWPGIFTYWNPSQLAAIQDPRQRLFADAVVNFHATWGKDYSSVQKLRTIVRKDLARWLEKTQLQTAQRLAELNRRSARRLQWVAIALALVAFVVVVGAYVDQLTVRSAATVMCIIIVAILGICYRFYSLLTTEPVHGL